MFLLLERGGGGGGQDKTIPETNDLLPSNILQNMYRANKRVRFVIYIFIYIKK